MSSKESQLTQTKAKALKAFSQKDYATSTELYAEACELQSAIQGENNPKNAHLLYLYGRSLFEVALKKSDVLGGVTQEDKKPKEEKKKKSTDKLEASVSGAATVIGDKALEMGIPNAKSGLFSFTGDENWDDSDEEVEDEEGEGEGAEEEQDDDFTLAWEILDYTRVLFLKQLSLDATDNIATSDIPPVDSATADNSTEPAAPVLSEEGPEEEPEETTGEKHEEKDEKDEKDGKDKKDEKDEKDGKDEKDEKEVESIEPVVLSEDEVRAIHIALADTYDLLGEVSLESESFEQAAKDLRSSLDLKLELYPIESTLISEGHYKLSLALEFAAAGEDVPESARMKGREEATVEMEKAIASCKARIEKEEKQVAVDAGDDKGKGVEQVTKSLTDAKQLVEELETRLADLRASPTEVAMDPLRGILGQVLGEDQVTAKKRIEEAISGARDLTGLVRKKQPTATPVAVGTPKPAENGSAKRKLDDLQEEEEPVVEGGKKPKVSDSEEP